MFALLAAAYAASLWQSSYAASAPDSLQRYLGGGTVLAGLAGVCCSVMIYRSTRRPCWTGIPTAVKFLLTTVVLGLAGSMLLALVAAALSAGFAAHDAIRPYAHFMIHALLIAAAAKLGFEGLQFAHLGTRNHSPLKRSAMLMVGPLSRWTVARFTLGLTGIGCLLRLLRVVRHRHCDPFEWRMVGHCSTCRLRLSAGGRILRAAFVLHCVGRSAHAGRSHLDDALPALMPIASHPADSVCDVRGRSPPRNAASYWSCCPGRDPGSRVLLSGKSNSPDAVATSFCGFCSTGCALDIHLCRGEAVGLSPTVGISGELWEWPARRDGRRCRFCNRATARQRRS